MNRAGKTNNIFDFILNCFAYISGLCLVFIVISVCADVVIRNLFGQPVHWVFEIAEYLLLTIAFSGAAWCLREEGHVEMDIFTGMVSSKMRYLLKFITSILGGVLCAVLSWYAAECSIDFYKRGLYYPTLLEVPKSHIIGIVAIGFFLLFIQFSRRTRHYYILWKKPAST